MNRSGGATTTGAPLRRCSSAVDESASSASSSRSCEQARHVIGFDREEPEPSPSCRLCRRELLVRRVVVVTFLEDQLGAIASQARDADPGPTRALGAISQPVLRLPPAHRPRTRSTERQEGPAHAGKGPPGPPTPNLRLLPGDPDPTRSDPTEQPRAAPASRTVPAAHNWASRLQGSRRAKCSLRTASLERVRDRRRPSASRPSPEPRR